jgi:hypothetical protein
MKPRISIAQILALMVPIAFGLAALANPSAFWEGTIFALTMLLLFAAIVGVIYRNGGDRAFWLGFSVFGWGFYLLCSNISFEFRPSGQFGTMYSPVYWGNGEEAERPVRALTKSLIDYLPFNRRVRPTTVGEKIQVQWGNPSSYYPSSVLEIKADQYKIRYDSDRQGTFDEWVGIARIKLKDPDQTYRIGESLFGLLFALVGAVIARCFQATRKTPDSDQGSTPQSA